MTLNMNINIFISINQFINMSDDKKTWGWFIFGGTALRAAPEMGDYGGSAPVIPHFRRMRSIRTPENNLLSKPVITGFRDESCNCFIFIKNVYIM